MWKTLVGSCLSGLLALAVSGAFASVTNPRATPPKSRPALSQMSKAELASISAGFKVWVKAFRAKALAKGISAKVYARAFRGVKYNTHVIAKDRNQSEFTKQIWEYLDIATSDKRVRDGKAAYKKYRKLFTRIQQKYGVDAKVVLAIWGLESAYGKRMGNIPVIESLATLAYEGRRRKFFETQLLAALRILQSGDIQPANMVGSWAGAMGHTQFIPTSYLAFAQDFRGDGKRDIWGKNPADALASTANYLARKGWVKGQPWGMEVKLPTNFNYSLASAHIRKKTSKWRTLGVTRINGKPIPDYGDASILLPAGAKGAAFITFQNFRVLKKYNAADAYVIAVGHLGDMIMGGPPIRASWPRGDKALSRGQKKDMQRLLGRRGFETQKIDGIIGPNTIAAIRAFQTSIGVTPDGYASSNLLKRLREN